MVDESDWKRASFSAEPQRREGAGLRRRQQKVPQREWTGRARPPQPPTPAPQRSRSTYTHVSLSQKSLSSRFRSVLLKIRMAWRPASGVILGALRSHAPGGPAQPGSFPWVPHRLIQPYEFIHFSERLVRSFAHSHTGGL